MIKSVGIVNFLSHRETFVEFVPGLNVLAGPSDNGKSAVVQAISWVARNKPNGDAIKNWDAGKKESVAVEVVLAEEATGTEVSVLKERKGSTSSYTLSTLPKTLDVIGQDVPTEVQRIFNFSPLNLKGQHDPYLLQMSGGQIARMINDIVGLSIIHTSTKNLNSKANELKSKCNTLIGDIEGKDKSIEEMAYLADMDAEIAAIENLETNKAELTRLSFEVLKTVENIEKTQTELNSVRETIAVLPEAEDITALIKEEYRSRIDAIAKLSGVIGSIDNIQDDYANEKMTLEALPATTDINELLKQLSRAEKEKARVSQAIVSVEVLAGRFTKAQDATSKAAETIKQFKDIFAANLKKMGFCPTCKRPLDNKTIKGIVG